MNTANLIQAVRGPLMLITLGILFAIDHFGRFSFSSTWPLLVIVFGVLKLAERAAMPSDTHSPNTPGGGNPS